MTISSKLLRSPLVRIVGAVVILYYALFANTYEKDSLGNRLSKQTIEKNIEDAKKKSLYIALNVKQAQNYKERNPINNSASNTNLANQNLNTPAILPVGLIIKDIEITQGKEVECGSKITANYIVYDNNGKQLTDTINYVSEIDENSPKSVIKENLIGLKTGSKRLIILPANYKTLDSESSKYMALSRNSGINYEIKLIKVEELKNAEAKCNWSSTNNIFLH